MLSNIHSYNASLRAIEFHWNDISYAIYSGSSKPNQTELRSQWTIQILFVTSQSTILDRHEIAWIDFMFLRCIRDDQRGILSWS